MTTKVVEVLAQILDGLNKNYSLEDVNNKLSTQKRFDKQTVSAAFSLVYDKILDNSNKSKKKQKNIRFLNEGELEKIGIEYYDYILHLQNIKLIDSEDIEILLEQLMLYPTESFSIEDINWMILVTIVDYNAKISPGSRMTLYSSDKIN